MTAAPLPLEKRPRVTWLDLLTIAVVTAAVFIPVLRTGFAPLDDYVMLAGNDNVSRPTWDAVVRSWTEPSYRIYMPLALTVWQSISALTRRGEWGTPDFVLPVMGFKIASIVTHALAAAAAAWALSVVTRTRWPTILGALVFALHPLQVESVAWTTGLKDELCGLFSILAIGLFARHVGRDPASPFTDLWWWAAMAAAVLAMLAKPTAMVTPVILFAVDWAMRRTTFVKRFMSVAPTLLPAIACGLIIVSVQNNSPVKNVAIHLRPLVAGDSLAFYLWKFVWPSDLAVDYGRRPLAIVASGAVWWTWLLPAFLFGVILVMRSPRWWLACVLFVVPILPVSGLTAFDMQQYSTVTDHYAYLSLLGAALAVAMLVARWPRLAGMTIVTATCVLAVMTYQTATRWQNLEAFYRRNLEINPQSWLARDLLTLTALKRGDIITARLYVQRSLAANPNNGTAWENESTLQLYAGRYDQSFDAGRIATQKLLVPRVYLARRLTLLGRALNDPAKAEVGLRYWLKLEPDNRFVIDMLQVVRAAQREQAATRAATQPATQLSSPATRP